MKVNQKKAGVILSYVSIFLSVAISLVYTPFLIRSLGQAQYGLYGLVNTVIVYFTVFDFGFGNAIIRYSAKYRALGDEESQKKLNGMLLILYTVIGLVVAILGVVLALNTGAVFQGLTAEESGIMQTLIIIAVFNVALSFPFTVFKSLIKAYEKFIFARVMEIVLHVIKPLTIVIILLLGYKAIGIVLGVTVITIVLNIIKMTYCFTKLNIKFKIPKSIQEWKGLKGISVYSFYVFLNLIVDRLFWSTGHFVLGIVQTSVAIAIFSLAIQIVNYYKLFSTSMASVFLPQISQIAGKKENNYMAKLSSLFNRTGRLQFYIIALVLTGFIFFGRQFINLWAGSDYDQAYIIILILIIPLSIPLIQNVGISILQGLNKHKFRSVIYLVVALVNAGISVPLAMKWGPIGSAIATSLTLTIGPVFIINIYYVKLGLDIKGFWISILKILPSLIIPIGAGFLLNYVFETNKIIWLALSIFLYTIIYVISVWFISMNKYEKELITQPLNRVFKKLKRKGGENE